MGKRKVNNCKNPFHNIKLNASKNYFMSIMQLFSQTGIYMRNCGLKDPAGALIIDLITRNNSDLIFDVKNNEGISKHILEHIQKLMGDNAENIEMKQKITAKDVIKNLK